MNTKPNPNLLATVRYPNGIAIFLTRQAGFFYVEVVAHRLLDGRPWYPTVDSDSAENEFTGREFFEEAQLRWATADQQEIGAEVFADPEEWDRSTLAPLLAAPKATATVEG